MTVYLQYKGGAFWRVKKSSFISISKAPGALFRRNTVAHISAHGTVPLTNSRILNYFSLPCSKLSFKAFLTQDQKKTLREKNIL